MSFQSMIGRGVTTLLVLISVAGLHTRAFAQGFPTTFADIVEKAIPTVVVVQVAAGTSNSPLELEEFFEEAPGGSGSGFFIDADGHIATNEHVVSAGGEVSVQLSDGTVRAAELLGVDVDTDLAVLKIDPTGLNFQPVEWADSETIRVGDWVIAVGNPLNVGVTVTHGIVSALNRDLSLDNPFDQLIQTDAAINSGNSGGPSFNIEGKVMGVNRSIISRNGGNIGIAFMIPSNVAREIVEQLKEFGEVRRGFLGVRIGDMTDELRDRLNFEGQGGVFVNRVFEGLPADRAGLMAGDVIMQFNGRDVDNVERFIPAVASLPPGTSVDLEVFRDGEIVNLTLELTLRETETLAQNETLGSDGLAETYGAQAIALTLAERLLLDLNPSDGGARIVGVDPDNVFGQAGMEQGDVVLEIDMTPVFGGEDLFQILEARAEEGLIAVRVIFLRDGQENVVEMMLP